MATLNLPNPPKYETVVIGKFLDFVVYGYNNPAKKKGKDRVWISVKQTGRKGEKKWLGAGVLAYPHGVDIPFVRKEK